MSAAAGAVGSVAGQLAKADGARVVGIAGGPEKTRDAHRASSASTPPWTTRPSDWREQLAAATPDGIDVDFENVGGEIMDAIFARLNIRSRVALCGLISGYNEERAPAGPAGLRQPADQARPAPGLHRARPLPPGARGRGRDLRRSWPRASSSRWRRWWRASSSCRDDQHAVRRRERRQARRAHRRRLIRPPQSEGHGRGLELPGRRQASTRAGARPRRTRKRVYLPMVAGLGHEQLGSPCPHEAGARGAGSAAGCPPAPPSCGGRGSRGPGTRAAPTRRRARARRAAPPAGRTHRSCRSDAPPGTG